MIIFFTDVTTFFSIHLIVMPHNIKIYLRRIRMKINNKFSPFLDFFSKPGALSEPEDEKNRLMARNLLYFVSEPHNIDNRGFYPNMWSLSYYTVESWLKNQNSIFFQLYKDEIEKTALLGKIDILKKHITLSNRADELMPKSLHMKPRKEADVWKQLGDSRLENWYNEYQKKLIQLNADYKIHYDLLKNHEKNINILFKNFSKNKENRELKDSLHINQWIHSSTVKGFWGRLDKSALSAEEGLLKRIDFSELKKTIEMNPRALTNS
ncbi:hypothetical protein PPACK8108_LOCUS9124 [Phakopsora pachyrhizi]|uniref:Uncharacterized protein n=1 Tax=Phakopsora pachyrhizi TaxID=170000 RepID=A0AAV0AWJ4_PHAPC|nr:hypothetical protein PPACK8108_LOCUS9124 [Phakopsora pachyrhizi]